jgi:peptidoglycan hydrolase-like protein with peptidoglycan-binding domain
MTEEEAALELLLQQRRQGAFGGAPAEPQGAFGVSQRNPYALLGEAIQNNDPGPPRNIPHDLATMGMSALDPFGMTSGAIGMVSPETQDFIRAQYEANPESATAGAFLTPVGPMMKGAGVVAKGVKDALTYSPTATGVGAAGALGMMPSAAGSAPSENVKQLQMRLRDAGFYRGKIDGEMGLATREANDAYLQDARQKEAVATEQARAAAEAAKAQADATKAQAQIAESQRLAKAAEEAARRRQEGEERLRGIEENVPTWRKALRDYGPTAGYVAGLGVAALTRKGVNKASDYLSEKAASRADDLMRGNPAKKDMPERVSKVNQYWGEGGAKDVPFLPNPGKSPPYKPNPKATGPEDLYQPSPKKNLATDAGVTGVFAADAALGQLVLTPEQKAELAAAREALEKDPSEANINRFQAALDKTAASEFATNMGRAATVAYPGLGLKMQRKPVRPDVNKAEAERMRIDESLSPAARKAQAQAKASKKTDDEVVADLRKATEAPPKLPDKAASGTVQDLKKDEKFKLTAAELVAQLEGARANRDIVRQASASFENKRKLTDVEARMIARQFNNDNDFQKAVEKAKKAIAKRRETRDGKAALEALGRTRKETD